MLSTDDIRKSMRKAANNKVNFWKKDLESIKKMCGKGGLPDILPQATGIRREIVDLGCLIEKTKSKNHLKNARDEKKLIYKATRNQKK